MLNISKCKNPVLAGFRNSISAVATFGLIASTGVIAQLPTMAAAQNVDHFGESDGSKARINLSARLRSLTEDVAATSCRLVSETALETDAQHLKTVTDTFDAILNGLEKGDNSFGIPTPETAAGLMNQIQQVREAWTPIRESTDRLLAGSVTTDDLQVLASSHRGLLPMTEVLATEISGTYSNPLELLQADAVTLNFLGRQRSLATRFARAACGIYTDNPEVGSAEELQVAMGQFEQTYGALINGMPAAGVSAPPSEAVKNVLEASQESWVEEKAVLSSDGAHTEDAVLTSAAFASDAVRETNNAITLYILASPGQSDVFEAVLQSYTTDQLLSWLDDPIVIESIIAQNAAHAGLNDADVVALDDEWRAEAKGEEGDLIATTLANPLSQWLADKAIGTAGIVTEVFVMDNKGLNVGQSAQTSDFWQGDEGKWQETYGAGVDDLHVSELEYDESSQSYQTQASKIIRDPATGDAIGAVTFGINVMNLM